MSYDKSDSALESFEAIKKKRVYASMKASRPGT
jgi:hypothetical protein